MLLRPIVLVCLVRITYRACIWCCLPTQSNGSFAIRPNMENTNLSLQRVAKVVARHITAAAPVAAKDNRAVLLCHCCGERPITTRQWSDLSENYQKWVESWADVTEWQSLFSKSCCSTCVTNYLWPERKKLFPHRPRHGKLCTCKNL